MDQVLTFDKIFENLCFLTDCSVNYTPDAVYATYDDTTPVSMMLTLNFQEIVPIYDYDFDNGPGVSAIGY